MIDSMVIGACIAILAWIVCEIGLWLARIVRHAFGCYRVVKVAEFRPIDEAVSERTRQALARRMLHEGKLCD